MRDLRHRIGPDAVRDRLRRLAERVPGFSGYTRKEERREADRVLRTHLAERLEQQRAKIEDIQAALLNTSRFGQLTAVEASVVRLQTIADEIRTASYGYAGWFDEGQVDEEELGAIYAYDVSLADGITWVEANRERLSTAIQDGDEDAFASAAADLSDTLDRLADQVVRRRQLITDVKRPPQISPREMFKTAQEALQGGRVLPTLNSGDALSYAGSDYIVLGRVQYRSQDEGWQAYLLQNGEERWLWSTDGGRKVYLATVVPAPAEMEDKTEVDWQGETLSVVESGTALADIEGSTGRQGGVTVEFWRLVGPSGKVLWLERWEEEILAFLGEPVDLSEVEVWQQPTSG